MIKKVTDPNGNNHQITIDDDLKWMAPFLSEAKRGGIPVWRVREIKGYVIPEGKAEQQHAALLKDENKKVTLTILKKKQVLTGDGIKAIYVTGYADCEEGYYYESTLNSLAHELAHLVEWEHTADRFIIESKLMVRFARLSKKRGYTGYDG